MFSRHASPEANSSATSSATSNSAIAAKKILFIGGTLNQTLMMHEVARHLGEHELYFSYFYMDSGILKTLADIGIMHASIVGKGKFYNDSMAYFQAQGLRVDPEGQRGDYDLVVTCTDLILPTNIRGKKIVVVQEGMMDPKNVLYYLARLFKLPGWVACNTSTTGLSDAFVRFCVASGGYRDLFVSRGVNPAKIAVTGIPNFDNAVSRIRADFPHRGYVLVATSDRRETLRFENRQRTIEDAVRIAAGRPLIFKLHPNEKLDRAVREIERHAPGATVIRDGDAHELVANCEALVTKYSSVVYTALALNKEVHCLMDVDTLRPLMPLQNGGVSGQNIARVCRDYLQ